MKFIRLDDETHKTLSILKAQLGAKNQSETIIIMMKKLGVVKE